MKRKLSFPGLMMVTAATCISLSLASCKSGPKDADILTSVNTAIGTVPGLSATVKDGVVTLAGEFKDPATKDAIETAVKGLPGVKNLVDNGTIAPPPPPVAAAPVVSADDNLVKSLSDAVKDFSMVKTDVKDGVVTLTGQIKRMELPKLLQHINALKPKKIVNQLEIK